MRVPNTVCRWWLKAFLRDRGWRNLDNFGRGFWDETVRIIQSAVPILVGSGRYSSLDAYLKSFQDFLVLLALYSEDVHSGDEFIAYSLLKGGQGDVKEDNPYYRLFHESWD